MQKSKLTEEEEEDDEEETSITCDFHWLLGFMWERSTGSKRTQRIKSE